MKKYIAINVVGCVLILGNGCSTSHDVTLLAPDKQDVLWNSSQTVIKGVVIDTGYTTDLTLGEQFQVGGMPSKPQNGYKKDFTIKIDSVLKGTFSGSVLTLHDLKDPAQTGYTSPSLWLGPKQMVYVGWKSESSGNFSGLMIVNAEKVLTTEP